MLIKYAHAEHNLLKIKESKLAYSGDFLVLVITEDSIKKGKPRCPCNCVIAKEAQKVFPDKFVHVLGGGIYVTPVPGKLDLMEVNCQRYVPIMGVCPVTGAKEALLYSSVIFDYDNHDIVYNLRLNKGARLFFSRGYGNADYQIEYSEENICTVKKI